MVCNEQRPLIGISLISICRWLYRDGFVPENTCFIGYARSQLTVEKIFQNAAKYMKVRGKSQDKRLSHCSPHRFKTMNVRDMSSLSK